MHSLVDNGNLRVCLKKTGGMGNCSCWMLAAKYSLCLSKTSFDTCVVPRIAGLLKNLLLQVESEMPMNQFADLLMIHRFS